MLETSKKLPHWWEAIVVPVIAMSAVWGVEEIRNNIYHLWTFQTTISGKGHFLK